MRQTMPRMYRLLRRRFFTKVFRQRGQVGIYRCGVPEDVARHETEQQVRYLTVFSNRHTRAAILRGEQVGPLAREAEIGVTNPRYHPLGRSVFHQLVIDGPILSHFTKINWSTLW